MNAPLLLAGALSLLAAVIHGVGGEMLVVRRLAPERLPPSVFGGPGMTKLMIRASWHITTFAFLTVGAALVLAGSVLHGEFARGVGLIAAVAASGFAVVTVGGGLLHSPRALTRHLGPAALTTVAVLAWWGLAI
jgi:hypothetical protein